MIRLLLIIPTLVRGGAEKQLTLLARGLPRDEFDVHVAVLTHSGPLEATLDRAGIPLTIIGKRWKFDPLSYWRLRRHIRALRPDIVHTWLFAANAYGRQAAAARASGTSSPASGASIRGKRPGNWPSTGRLARTHRADRDQQQRRQRFLCQPRLAGGKVRDHSQWHCAGTAVRPPAAARKLLAELRLPPNARLIGAVGRLWPQKRVKDLIWAADLLKSTRDDTHLLIIGDGPQRSRLERYREQIQITDRVHFLGERDDVPRLMPHFDVLWLASEYEGQSNAIMEAMAAARARDRHRHSRQSRPGRRWRHGLSRAAGRSL